MVFKQLSKRVRIILSCLLVAELILLVILGIVANSIAPGTQSILDLPFYILGYLIILTGILWIPFSWFYVLISYTVIFLLILGEGYYGRFIPFGDFGSESHIYTGLFLAAEVFVLWFTVLILGINSLRKK